MIQGRLSPSAAGNGAGRGVGKRDPSRGARDGERGGVPDAEASTGEDAQRVVPRVGRNHDVG
jgi:hypothetical protein